MFFGLQVKSNQNQAKPTTLATSLKLSQAVLEPSKNAKEPVCLVAEYEKKQFILCVLDPSKAWQSPLDLIFEGGSEVKFFLRGTGTVHLTGYEVIDDMDDMSMSMSEDEEITSESDEEPAKKMIMARKSPAKKSPKAITNGFDKPNKNKKFKKDEAGDDDDDEEDSDDEDFDVMAQNSDTFDEDDDDDDDDDDVDDEDDGMSDESIEIEEESDEE